MNDIRLFSNEVFGNVRAIVINNEVWFVGKDVAEALGYTNSNKALNDHCKPEGVTKRYTLTSGGKQEIKYINQRNVIRLIMRSKLPQAEEFQDWVEDEIIPSILETGSYGIPQLTERDSAILAVMNSKNDVEFVGALKNLENVITKPLLNTIEEQQDTIDKQDAKIEELDTEVNTLLDISDLPLDTIRSRIFEFMRSRYESYGALYSEFDLRYHIRSGIQFANYKKDYLERWERGEVKKKDMINSQLAYICDELEMAEELYLVMADVFSTDFIYFLKTKLDDFEY